MDPSIATEVLRALLSGLILAILFGAIATWIWVIPRLFRGKPLLPEDPIVERRRPPWGVGTILLVLVLYVLVSRYAFQTYGRAAHPERAKAGAAAPDPAKPDPKHEEKPDRGPVPDAPAKPDAEQPGHADDKGADELPYGLTPSELMAIQAAINAAFILLVPLLARLTSGAGLRDFGLSLHQWRRQVAIGVISVLFLMPIVYSIQAACIRLFDMSGPEIEKNKHPLEKMLHESFSPGIASMAFLTAVVLAPFFEELLFRGFIQPWLVKVFGQLAAGHSSLTKKATEDPSPSEVSQIPPPADQDYAPFPAGPAADIEFWEPAEGPADALESAPPTIDEAEEGTIPFRPRSPLWTIAVVLTSLIFAALHAPQWPAPIPLFLLALGLGFVAQRTGSLIAPICMHAIFNGFSTLMLFFVALERPDQGKPPARPVLERVAPVEKAGAVAPKIGPGPHQGKS